MTPACGNRCNVQEESTTYESTGNAKSVYVNFEVAVSIAEDDLAIAKEKFNDTLVSIGSEPKRNILFHPGEISGKYQFLLPPYKIVFFDCLKAITYAFKPF